MSLYDEHYRSWFASLKGTPILDLTRAHIHTLYLEYLRAQWTYNYECFDESCALLERPASICIRRGVPRHPILFVNLPEEPWIEDCPLSPPCMYCRSRKPRHA